MVGELLSLFLSCILLTNYNFLTLAGTVYVKFTNGVREKAFMLLGNSHLPIHASSVPT